MQSESGLVNRFTVASRKRERGPLHLDCARAVHCSSNNSVTGRTGARGIGEVDVGGKGTGRKSTWYW